MVDATEQEIVASYKTYLQTPEAQTSIPTFAEDLDKAQQYINQTETESEDEEQPHSEEQEDWMVLCQ